MLAPALPAAKFFGTGSILGQRQSNLQIGPGWRGSAPIPFREPEHPDGAEDMAHLALARKIENVSRETSVYVLVLLFLYLLLFPDEKCLLPNGTDIRASS
jgi:hypothetical protein